MKIFPFACLLTCISIAASAAEPVAADRELARALASELKAALTEALAKSPEHAIGVCSERAPQIAQRIATEQDVQIGRTALRVRNPANAPMPWQRATLEEFEQRRGAGEALASMESVSVVTEGGYIERRYMKAIGTEPLCVTCHGAKLSPELTRAIAEKYPQDAATGFKVGDLRGAVYVVRRMRRP